MPLETTSNKEITLRKSDSFSAAYLVKTSARQMWHFHKHADKDKASKMTMNIIEGGNYQEEQTKSPYMEMGSSFSFYGPITRGITIYFCFDEIRIHNGAAYLIEHKHVRDGEPESWYLRSSLIQLAFYQSLAFYCDQQFKTASFVNGPKHELSLKDKSKYYRLNFGGKWYSVVVRHPNEIVRFFLTKIRSSRNWGVAAKFDAKYKHKEWELYFKDYIFYKKWNPPPNF